MKFILSTLPVHQKGLRRNYSDTMLIVGQRILKFILLTAKCLLVPFCRVRCLKKRKLLPPITNKLLLSSATTLAQRIRRKEISSVDVISAYVQRCKDVNPILNAIVEERFEAAIQDARKVDEFIKSTTKTEDELAREMPLLGIPITVKESIAVRGMSNNAGVKENERCKVDKDAPIVTLVREAGAIVLLVSNTPELCLFWESCNNVTGTTWNPYDTNRTPGGSSGGEAALVGSGASLLSLASDIAGSVRLPAMFCGVYGHKATPRLVPCRGHNPESNSEEWPEVFTLGPMVRYAEDFPLILKVISQSEEMCRRLEQKVSLKDLRFYYLEECSVVTTSIDNDVKWAIQKLKRHVETEYGVEVQKAHIDEMKISFNITSKLLLHTKVDWNGVKAMDSVFLEILKYIFRLSSHMLYVSLYGLMTWVAVRLPHTYYARMLEKKASMKKQYEELLGDNGVLICPTFVTTAYYPHETYYNTANFTHMTIYNLLGLPVTQCTIGLNSKGLPVGVQIPNIAAILKLQMHILKNHDSGLLKLLQEMNDIKRQGLLSSQVQIVANSGCDHLSIAVAQEIERAFGGWQQPPSKKAV